MKRRARNSEGKMEPEEAEEVFALAPLYRKTKKGHYAVMGSLRILDGTNPAQVPNFLVANIRRRGNIARACSQIYVSL